MKELDYMAWKNLDYKFVSYRHHHNATFLSGIEVESY